MRFAELVAVSQSVAETSARLGKIDRLAALLQRLAPGEIETAIAFLSGSPRQGRIGIGGAAVMAARAAEPRETPVLEIADVDEAFERVARVSGEGSTSARGGILRDLLGRATRDEQDFLVRLVFGELRLGALEGLLLEAVARASRIPAARVRRAAMMAGALGPVARAALVEGDDALTRFMVRLFQPVQPMLAQSAAGVETALAALGEAAFEYKLDGARIQVHKSGDEVRIFSRTLREVTLALPEVAEAVRALDPREIILDGEAIALRPDGTPEPFQITMRRFGRRLDVETLRGTLPIAPVFFDVLYLNGATLVDEPHARRMAEMARIVPARVLVPRIVTSRPDEAARFLARSAETGHEGVMAKAVAGTYAAGRRGQAWLKIKRARTLDLVVLAAEWGHGRRRGTLSNLHLAARDPVRGGFVMLGKTFKGLTDQMLAWQTKKLLEIEVARDPSTVYVRPELVVEIAFNDIQESSQYPGRLALRFARVKRYRTDKPASEADTLAAVQAIYTQTTGREPPSS
jgi:DNA ligase-1